MKKIARVLLAVLMAGALFAGCEQPTDEPEVTLEPTTSLTPEPTTGLTPEPTTGQTPEPTTGQTPEPTATDGPAPTPTPTEPPPHVHQWGEWTVITPATCTTAGIKTRTCALDGTTETEELPIDPDAHQWNDNWVITTPATYTADGVETDTCAHDPLHTRTRSIAKLPPLESVADLGTWLAEQSTNTAETAYYVKLNVDNIDVTLRTTLNNAAGKYVYLNLSGSTFTSVPNNLFYGTANPRGCATLVGIILPNSVESIGERAFSNCSSLTSVTIPDSVTSIEYYAFYGCTSLTSVTIPNSVTSIWNWTFYNCTSLTSVTFATGSNIADSDFGGNVFPGNDNLKTVYSTGKAGTYTRAANGSTWTKQE